MDLYVDATTLYDLGQIGELELLTALEGRLVLTEATIDEITVEPAATNLDRFLDENDVETSPEIDGQIDDAKQLLDTDIVTNDVSIIAGLLAARAGEEEVGLVSDDKRLRAIGEGVGAKVTGTFGVTARASLEDKYFPTSQAKRVIRRTDHHGLQMTGRLRERAIGEVDG